MSIVSLVGEDWRPTGGRRFGDSGFQVSGYIKTLRCLNKWQSQELVRRQQHLPTGHRARQRGGWFQRHHLGEEPYQNPSRQSSFHRENHLCICICVSVHRYNTDNRKLRGEEAVSQWRGRDLKRWTGSQCGWSSWPSKGKHWSLISFRNQERESWLAKKHWKRKIQGLGLLSPKFFTLERSRQQRKF